jgi:uncharacterized protein YjbI with pentapeptide repeats
VNIQLAALRNVNIQLTAFRNVNIQLAALRNVYTQNICPERRGYREKQFSETGILRTAVFTNVDIQHSYP